MKALFKCKVLLTTVIINCMPHWLLTAQLAPDPPGSAYAAPFGIPLASTWSRSPATLGCHNNHIPSYTAALTDQREFLGVLTSGSSSCCCQGQRFALSFFLR